MKDGRISLVTAVFVWIAGCTTVFGGLLPTVPSTPSNATDVYTIILYGARHAGDLESVAILDRENDGYVIMPEGPEFDYEVRGRVKGTEAVHIGQEFIGWHRSFMRSSFFAILAPDGTVIGFELSPRYNPVDYGTDDVLDISYRMEENRVTVHIRLKPDVERILEGDGAERLLKKVR